MPAPRSDVDGMATGARPDGPGCEATPSAAQEGVFAKSHSSREQQAFQLWGLLDDIDTLDDACRANDAAFRRLAREIQRKRFTVMSGEDWDAIHMKGIRRA